MYKTTVKSVAHAARRHSHPIPNKKTGQRRTQQIVASTWLGNHRERPSARTNSLHKLLMARYQVHQLQLQIKLQ